MWQWQRDQLEIRPNRVKIQPQTKVFGIEERWAELKTEHAKISEADEKKSRVENCNLISHARSFLVAPARAQQSNYFITFFAQ